MFKYESLIIIKILFKNKEEDKNDNSCAREKVNIHIFI